MKKTLIRCIVIVHESWKKDIRLYHEEDKLYVKYVEKYYDKVQKTTVDFGNVEPENVTKAKKLYKKYIIISLRQAGRVNTRYIQSDG